jgi:hypothetical protein
MTLILVVVVLLPNDSITVIGFLFASTVFSRG